MTHSVVVILVNYKNAEKTLTCIRAIEKNFILPKKIYVIDNASNKDSQKFFQRQNFSIETQFIFNSQNYGFAAACNQGIERSLKFEEADYFWLLNNDTIPEQKALEELLKTADTTHAGITGSQILDMHGNFSGGVSRLHPLFASVTRVPDLQTEKFDCVEGSSFFISKECIQRTGILSEEYFLYFEESDYCKRANAAGFQMAWAKESIIRHDIGSSTGSELGKGKVPFFIDCLMIRNRIRFAQKFHYPFAGIWGGLFISLCLRLKRLQFKRIVTILWIILSQKNFQKFVVKNGGSFR